MGVNLLSRGAGTRRAKGSEDKIVKEIWRPLAVTSKNKEGRASTGCGSLSQALGLSRRIGQA